MTFIVVEGIEAEKEFAMPKQEVIVVTGAAADVGRAIAREFAQPGRSIILLARSQESLQDARHEAEDRGARALAIPLDIADAGQVEKAAEQIEQDLGPIDIWVNDAMTTIFALLVEITPEEYRRATVGASLLGTLWQGRLPAGDATPRLSRLPRPHFDRETSSPPQLQQGAVR
jgi:NAD(P)-dependent dehydrogenase (short-subunit alcohol dehydrogenase family)